MLGIAKIQGSGKNERFTGRNKLSTHHAGHRSAIYTVRSNFLEGETMIEKASMVVKHYNDSNATTKLFLNGHEIPNVLSHTDIGGKKVKGIKEYTVTFFVTEVENIDAK